MRRKPPIVEGLLDPKTQVGENGIDLSVGKLERFKEPGKVGFRSEDTFEPSSVELPFNSGITHLDAGCYKITYNETIHMPLDVVAIARTRSTLLRLGATVETALWDAGYEGRSESLLVVHNTSGLNLLKNARLVQLVFFRTTQKVKGYKGRYQKENL